MSNTVSLREFSATILSKPYWMIKELIKYFDISESSFNEYINMVAEKFDNIGITLELIELNNKDYLVPLIESETKKLSDLELGLLIIFGLKVKIEGGFLTTDSSRIFYQNYFKEMNFLIINNYILKKENFILELTPIGALTIIPYLDDVGPLVEKLFK